MLQQDSYGQTSLPLLMGFTPKTPIQTNEVIDHYMYSDTLQTTEYQCGSNVAATYSLKNVRTKTTYGSTGDNKNGVDDSRLKM